MYPVERKSYSDIKLRNALRDEILFLCPLICKNVAWVNITQPSSVHHVSWEARVDMEAKALFLRDFSVRRWFCSLGVRYITFSISAAKTRSHFSIVPERRGLGEMTGLCQSLRARKIRVTQLHTVPQASPKSPLRNWIHFRGFKARFFEIYSQSNPRNRIHPPLSVYISFAFRLARGKIKQHWS